MLPISLHSSGQSRIIPTSSFAGDKCMSHVFTGENPSALALGRFQLEREPLLAAAAAGA